MNIIEKAKILYVEDDRGYARLFKKKMERKGYQVDVAYDGEEGLSVWDPDKYDVLVLDYKLPVYNGTDFIKYLAKKGPLPPIIMVTGMADATVAVEAMKLGASDYIMKDTNVNYLELMPSVVDQVLHHHQLTEGKKKAEEALRTSEERYRSLFEHSNDAIVIHNFEGNVVDVNQRACEMLQKPCNELPGINIQEFLPSIKLPEFETRLEETKRNGNSLFETQFKLDDATIVDVEISSRVTDIDKKLIQSIIRDITVRKWMEKELVNKNMELKDFANRISHDLKNPLTLINGFAMAIKDSPELFDSHFQKIVDMSNRLIKFIDNLLKLSRAGIIINQRQEVNPNSLIKNLFKYSANSDISRELRIAEPIPPIFGDPRGIEDILKCLIENSIQNRDILKDQLILTTDWIKKGKFIILTLSDNGSGIRKEFINKVFDPGFSTGTNNTGVGLAIAKKIVDAHGGDIWIESEGPGKGTKCFLKLPAAKE